MSVKRMSAVLAAAAVAACSGPIVRSVATGGSQAAYELRGQQLEQLHAQAKRLCPHGFRILRQAQRFQQPQPDGNAAAPWLQQAGDWLSGMPGNEAQATVLCDA